MCIPRLALWAGAVLLMGLPLVAAADDPAEEQIQRKRGEIQPRVRAGSADLVPAQALEKLNLNQEQKAKFDRINQEFQDKQKDIQARLQEALKDRDRNKYREASQAQQQLRSDSLTKLEGVLTAAQKTTLEEVRREGPRSRPGIDGALRRPGAAIPGELLPAQLQERLQLTAEQKKKLAELQKDVESKIQNLLTEEQRKLLDEMKKRTRTRPPQESQLEPRPLPRQSVAQRPRRHNDDLKTGGTLPKSGDFGCNLGSRTRQSSGTPEIWRLRLPQGDFNPLW